jgi:hypothetical protein
MSSEKSSTEGVYNFSFLDYENLFFCFISK